MEVTSQLTVNIFCGIVFGLCVVFALILGCKPGDYWKLLRNPDLVSNFSSTYSSASRGFNTRIKVLMKKLQNSKK
jgi:hypothetical protein